MTMQRAIWVAILSLMIGLIPFPYNVAIIFTVWMTITQVVTTAEPKQPVLPMKLFDEIEYHGMDHNELEADFQTWEHYKPCSD